MTQHEKCPLVTAGIFMGCKYAVGRTLKGFLTAYAEKDAQSGGIFLNSCSPH